jgi:iron complex outermembrane recepter protein
VSPLRLVPLLLAASASAQDAAAPVQRLDPVVLTVGGAERRAFDTPFSVSVLQADDLRGAGPMVNLSEALARLPGVQALNRHNMAQDQQLSSRGFGARASFGVRGLRLYTDGIPASSPDGQGQVSHFDLAGASRVELLRGPFSALYGGSSGGVIALTSSAPKRAQVSVEGDAGSAGLRQLRASVATPLPQGFSLRAQLGRFELDGFRPQSSASRRLLTARLGWQGEQDHLTLHLNDLAQPALDPLGLTRAQFNANPDQTQAIALPQQALGEPDRFNTRKDTAQRQAGLGWRHRFNEAGALSEARVSAYAGRRAITQWQSIPVATQAAANHPGGVIDFERRYQGLDVRVSGQWPQLHWVLGLALERAEEDRRGFENLIGSGENLQLGVTGRLRRDEANQQLSREAYTQLEWRVADDWALLAGLRGGTLRYRVDDRYVVGTNGDDSGTRRYRFANPVLALQWKPAERLRAYLSLGRGFEAPTLNELAYRADGSSGLNPELRAQRSRQWEAGVKAQGESWRFDAALFEARTADEIGIASNRGGRASFRNVGRTLRRGLELSAQWQLHPTWTLQASGTLLDARYRDAFAVCAAPPCSAPSLPVAAGNRIAGTAPRSGYLELAWRPRADREVALEARAQGALVVDERNSDAAAGHGLVHVRWLERWPLPGGATLELLLRGENLFDRRVAGSVIVNEANGRFFEPGPGRQGLVSLRVVAPF